MHLLLLILRLLLNLFLPPGRNGLSLAARMDGGVEQVPADRALRDWWTGRQRLAATQRAKRALAVRAKDKASSSAETPPK